MIRTRAAATFVGPLALLASVAASCSDSDSIVRVNIDADPSVAGVVALHVVISNRGAADERTFPKKGSGHADGGRQPLELPTAFSLTMPSSRAGALDLAVEGLTESGTVVANGDAAVVLDPGDQVSVGIILRAGASLCGNGTVDVAAGETCDDGDRISSGECDFRCQRRGGGAGGTSGGAGTSGMAGTSGVAGTTGTAGTRGSAGTTGGDAGGAGGDAAGTGGGGDAGGTGGTGGAIPCTLELLTNGDFESGMTGWTSFTSGRALIYDYADVDPTVVPPPDSAPNLAWLGYDVLSETVILRQTIQVPPGTQSLTISGALQIWSDDDPSIVFDVAYLELVMAGTPYEVYDWSNVDKNTSWGHFARELDTTGFPGGSAIFQIRVFLDDGANTSFFFDSLSVVAGRCH
jgi:hypothetical protein